MVNEHGQVVCNIKKIILNDGVTLLPGYIEAEKTGKYTIHHSSDPNNKLPYHKKKGRNVKKTNVGILRNRLKDGNKNLVQKATGTDDRLKNLKETMHFMNLAVMNQYLA